MLVCFDFGTHRLGRIRLLYILFSLLFFFFHFFSIFHFFFFLFLFLPSPPPFFPLFSFHSRRAFGFYSPSSYLFIFIFLFFFIGNLEFLYRVSLLLLFPLRLYVHYCGMLLLKRVCYLASGIIYIFSPVPTRIVIIGLPPFVCRVLVRV